MLSFEAIKMAWDKVKQRRSSEFGASAPSLSDLENVSVSMVRRDATSVTVQFDNIDEAVDEIPDIARLKNAILTWIKSFAQVRLSRAGHSSMVVTIELKPEFEKTVSTRPASPNKPPARRPGGPQTAIVGRSPAR